MIASQMAHNKPESSAVDISVVVPARNAAGVIIDCIQALKNQQLGQPFEVIVVNDGSSDNTADLAEAAGVRVIRHDVKKGAAAARNSGINAATGDIICFTDADCKPKENWLEQILQPFADQEIIGAKGTYATKQREVIARFVQIEYEDKYDLLLTQERINFIDTYSAAYRRQILVANDGFDEQIFYVEDQELSFRLAARGYQMVFQPDAIVYHLHSSNLSSYFRKKFMIGYWKAQILRRFPGRAVQDSHTPQVLKAQILLLALILAAAAGTLLTRWSAIGLLVAIAVFLASTVPFIAKAWPKDRAVALVAPLVLATRAFALGFGYAWGLIKSQPDVRQEHTIDGLNFLLKRAMDITGGFFGVLLTIIVWPLIGLAIKLDTAGPVMFKQERIGQEGKPFTLYKFRSMIANAEAELAHLVDINSLQGAVYKQKDDPRLTRVGRTLRRWSIDELPQFWNVLKGDMSLVGPRPEETRFVAMYDDWHRRRLAVKPGMTGPMQVNGRGDLPLDTRVQLDLDYIENYSLWRDVAILLQTIPAVVRGYGAH
jgi:lipopolysaccharide/colanic/teichoic acid biosynthesis glycosyltransferase/glycosyltransferase involved in cell wall biosynthesis